MERFKIILNLLLGRNMVIYNSYTNELIMILTKEEKLIKKRHDYCFMNDKEILLEDENDIVKIIL